MHSTFLYHNFCYNSNSDRKMAKHIVQITPSIIQKTHQLNIQWSELNLVKLSYLAVSVDWTNINFHMTCLLPTYWWIQIPQKQNKKIYKLQQYIMRHSETGFQGVFCPPSTLCYNIATRFLKLIRPLFHSFILVSSPLWKLNPFCVP